MPAAAVSLQRKKSLPDVAQPIQLTATAPLSREEVSVLSSMRREEIRRQIDESERLRANPLLYLVSPQVKVSIVIEFQKSFLKIYLYRRRRKIYDPILIIIEMETLLLRRCIFFSDARYRFLRVLDTDKFWFAISSFWTSWKIDKIVTAYIYIYKYISIWIMNDLV